MLATRLHNGCRTHEDCFTMYLRDDCYMNNLTQNSDAGICIIYMYTCICIVFTCMYVYKSIVTWIIWRPWPGKLSPQTRTIWTFSGVIANLFLSLWEAKDWVFTESSKCILVSLGLAVVCQRTEACRGKKTNITTKKDEGIIVYEKRWPTGNALKLPSEGFSMCIQLFVVLKMWKFAQHGEVNPNVWYQSRFWWSSERFDL